MDCQRISSGYVFGERVSFEAWFGPDIRTEYRFALGTNFDERRGGDTV